MAQAALPLANNFMSRRAYTFRARDKKLELGRRTHLMGVVNVTPDSFFDGGRFREAPQAIERCLELADNGADILDLGGESSRPGAEAVSGEEELKRILPVLKEVRKLVSLPISIDTYKSQVAEEALKEGADIVNDISAFRFDSELPEDRTQHLMFRGRYGQSIFALPIQLFINLWIGFTKFFHGS